MQKLPAATELPLAQVVPLPMTKSLPPEIATVWMFNTAFPELVNPNICGGLLVPTPSAPKTSVLGERLTAGDPAKPVPLRGTFMELEELLLFTITKLAVRLPTALGVKVTVMAQLAPTAMLPKQLSVSAKSDRFTPLMVTCVMLSALELSEFLSVTVWPIELVVPTAWLANDRNGGKTLAKFVSNNSAEGFGTSLLLKAVPPE
jgi:hypothetical protein